MARADCSAQGHLSPCVDADAFWPTPSAAPFFGVTTAAATEPGELLVGAAVSHAERLITLEVSAPDPAGRELPIVERVTTVTLLSMVGLGAGFDASLVLPWTVTQSGLGMGGIVAQRGDPLAPHPLRDPRIGLGKRLWQHDGATTLTLGTRYTVAIPLGNASALSGDRGVVGIPAFSFEFERGRLFAATELSARLRQPSRFANTRWGTQLVSALGVGVTLHEALRLTLAAEAFAAPTLVEQPGGDRLVPAEWMLSSSASPLGPKGPTVLLGGGGGIPWSTADSASVVGATASAWRFVAVLRQPLSRPRAQTPQRRSNRPMSEHSLVHVDRVPSLQGNVGGPAICDGLEAEHHGATALAGLARQLHLVAIRDRVEAPRE